MRKFKKEIFHLDRRLESLENEFNDFQKEVTQKKRNRKNILIGFMQFTVIITCISLIYLVVKLSLK